MPDDRAFDHGDAGLLGQTNHGSPRDSVENARLRRGRPQHPVLHDKDVVPGALGHFALVVEHQGLFKPGVSPLHLRQDVVEVIERLDAGGEGVRVIADRAGRDQGHSVLMSGLRVHADRVDNDDHLRIARAANVEPQRPRPARHHQANVAVLERVGRHGALHRLGHLGLRKRNRQPNRECTLIQSPDVLRQQKDLAAVEPNPLKHAVAVQQPVIINADFRVFLGNERAVEVNLLRHACIHLRV